jgi:hypothetical protein
MALEPREEYLSLNSLPRLKDLKKKPAHTQEFAEASLGLTEIDEDEDDTEIVDFVTENEEDSIMDIYENSQDVEIKEEPTSRQSKGASSSGGEEEMESIWVDGGAPKWREMEFEDEEEDDRT